jgi:hypothetical protein
VCLEGIGNPLFIGLYFINRVWPREVMKGNFKNSIILYLADVLPINDYADISLSSHQLQGIKPIS